MNPSTLSNPGSLSEKLLKLMSDENCPIAFNDIHERIGKDNAKQTVQKAIDWHVAKGRIIEKTYDKQKIYCINNKLSKINSDELKRNLRALDEEARKYQKSVDEKQERIKDVKSLLSKDINEIPLSQLQLKHSQLTESIQNLQSQADEMKRRDGPTLDPEEFDRLLQSRDKLKLEFDKRKRMCMRLIDGIGRLSGLESL